MKILPVSQYYYYILNVIYINRYIYRFEAIRFVGKDNYCYGGKYDRTEKNA